MPSIFEREKPLTEATMRRIARGLQRFVIDAARPYVVGDAAATLIQRSYGERQGQAPRAMDIEQPLGTVVAGGVKHALVAAYLAKHFGGHEGPGQTLTLPLGTVTCRDHHALVTASSRGERRDEVRAFLTRYNGAAVGHDLQLPLGTITTARRFGLVTVHGETFAIADIGMRFLVPRELYRAQGFPDNFVIDPIFKGKPLGKTAQIRLCGNSVCPPLAEAIVRANVVGAQEAAA